jgi:hypothetical protein
VRAAALLVAVAIVACTRGRGEDQRDRASPAATPQAAAIAAPNETPASDDRESLDDGSRSLADICAAARVTCPPEHPRLEVRKSAHRLRLYDGETLLAIFRVALGPEPAGAKSREGDGRTPEGTYPIVTRNPKSKYRKFLGIGYPGPEDARRGFEEKAISRAEEDAIERAHREHRAPPWDTALGGTVGVHGNGSEPDWTLGCVAVEDAAIDVLWDAIPIGTTVTIVP